MFSEPRKKPPGFLKKNNFNKKNYLQLKNNAIDIFYKKRYEDSLDILKELLNIKKNDYEIYNFIGIIFAIKKEFNKSILNFEKSLKINDQVKEVFFNLGKAYLEMGELEKSKFNFYKSLEIDPKNLDCILDLTIVLVKEEKNEEALNLVKQGLDFFSDNKELLFRYSNLLGKTNNFEEALIQFKKCINLYPNDENLNMVYGHFLCELHMFDEARIYFERGLEINYSKPMIHMSYSELLFRVKKFRAAWEEYEWRFVGEKPEVAININPIAIRGYEENLNSGKKVLLISEQGLGDTFQFIRYASTLKNKGIEIYMWAPKQLHKILRSSNLVDKFLTIGEANKFKEGSYIPLMSLPFVLKIYQNQINIDKPYLKISNKLNIKWKKKLSSELNPIICIHWQGNPEQEKGQAVKNNRSFNLESFLPLSKIKNISLLSLQKGFGSEQMETCSFKCKFVKIQEQIESIWEFSEIAAIINNCDLVITSDSALAHLAGGLGAETWLLLKYYPDWRWEVEGEKTYWYKSMRIFRQKKIGDWDSVHNEVAHAVNQKFMKL